MRENTTVVTGSGVFQVVSDSKKKLGCPCGRTAAKQRVLAYEECCGRYIEHWETQPAPDAQSLMRSRYTAFVRENAGYLLATWHASTRPQQVDFDAKTQWLGLEIKAAPAGAEHNAEVEFVARYRVAGRAVRLHEKSRFVFEQGRWYYLDGDWD